MKKDERLINNIYKEIFYSSETFRENTCNLRDINFCKFCSYNYTLASPLCVHPSVRYCALTFLNKKPLDEIKKKLLRSIVKRFPSVLIKEAE